jgi:hypothetical protein
MGRGRPISRRFSGRGSNTPPEQRRRVSQMLELIAADTRLERISVSALMNAMDARAVAALILLFALPNVLPTPPGTSAILGLPLLYLCAQMMMGRLPWLPALIADRSMTRADFGSFVARVSPVLARAERLLKPRWMWITSARSERVIGGFCLLLAIVLALPIPLGNMLPAFSICLMALGMLERDGLWVLAGATVGILSLLIVYGVVLALFKAAIFIVINAF